MRVERSIRFMRLTPCWGGWLAQFELATLYTAAVAQRAAEPGLGAQFIALLTGAETQALRIKAGFEQ